MIIEKIINFPNCSLAVFYSHRRAWQYSILLPHGRIISPSEIYKSPQAAERVGREAIKKVLDR